MKKKKTDPIMKHLCGQLAKAKDDAHHTANLLVELGKYYLSKDGTFVPQIHLWPGDKEQIAILDQSPASSLKLAANLRDKFRSTKSVTLFKAATTSPQQSDCLVVAVTDRDESYGWYTPYRFDDNGRPVFEPTFQSDESPEDIFSGEVRLEVTQ